MTQPKSRKTRSKSAAIHRMLRRRQGATLAEIGKATSWKPHSCRAFLSGVRKQGIALTKEARPNGDVAYKAEIELQP
ncbi:MAG: DUF3489 domain-containing protein [Alphaproteobacteria bacterium]|nr:MAG: DUF3489 domain-containing protein [Alphaproteobacteria bacterium]